MGDEREFIRIREEGASDWKRSMRIEEEKRYEVDLFFRNDANSKYNSREHECRGFALRTCLAVDLPRYIYKEKECFISAKFSYISRGGATKVCEDSIQILLDNVEEQYGKQIQYDLASAHIICDYSANGKVLPPTFLSDQGILIGLDEFDGIIPGGDEFMGHIRFAFYVESSVFAQKRIDMVSLKGGGFYEGETRNGTIHGRGRAVYGDWYEGEFANGAREGQGVFHFSDGSIYDGEWHKDKRHGKGIRVYASRARYEGDWYEDVISGNGRYYYENNDFYEGEFWEGLRDGNGVFHYSNGDIHSGEYHKGKIHGKGIYRWSNGSKYIGEYENGKRHGRGIMCYSNGDQYKGFFRDRRENFRGGGGSTIRRV